MTRRLYVICGILTFVTAISFGLFGGALYLRFSETNQKVKAQKDFNHRVCAIASVNRKLIGDLEHTLVIFLTPYRKDKATNRLIVKLNQRIHDVDTTPCLKRK